MTARHPQGEQIVRANGVDLCAQAFGDPADPAILLLHGAGNTMLSWDEEFCERLAAGLRFVIRTDGRVGRAHLVGMSAGAAIAQLAAIEHPGRVASLTLASSTPGIPGEETADLPGISDELAASMAHPPPEPDWADRAGVIDFLVEAERPYAARSRPFHEPAMRALAGRVFDRSPHIAANLANPFIIETGEPWRARLGQVSAPTLVIHGTEDPLFPFDHAVVLAKEIAGAELLALEHTEHEYFPRATWDIVVPAILRLTGR